MRLMLLKPTACTLLPGSAQGCGPPIHVCMWRCAHLPESRSAAVHRGPGTARGMCVWSVAWTMSSDASTWVTLPSTHIPRLLCISCQLRQLPAELRDWAASADSRPLILVGGLLSHLEVPCHTGNSGGTLQEENFPMQHPISTWSLDWESGTGPWTSCYWSIRHLCV